MARRGNRLARGAATAARVVEITVRSDDVDLDQPTVVEGLPGVGLVGKIATDHLIESLNMRYYADVAGDGLPPVAAFEADNRGVTAPVRLFVDPERDLLALRGDVPVSSLDAPGFASDLAAWLDEREALPILLSGVPSSREPDSTPGLYGIAAAGGTDRLASAGIPAPDDGGLISGPAGAVLSRAHRRGLDAVGLVVETDPRFPDPAGARTIIEDGIEALIDITVDTDPLVESAEEIIDAREQLAQRMRQAGQHESSQAEHTGMYR